MKRVLLFLLFIICYIGTVDAQTPNTTLTGTVTANNQLFTGTLWLSLSQPGIVVGTNGCGGPLYVLPNVQIPILVNNGVMQGTPKVWGADCLNPGQVPGNPLSGIPYNVKFTDQSGNTLVTDQWIIAGTSFNVGTAASVLHNTGVNYVAVPGAPGPNCANTSPPGQCNLTSIFTAPSILASSIGGVYHPNGCGSSSPAAWCPVGGNQDMGAWTNAAIANAPLLLPSIVECDPSQIYSIITPIVIDRPVTFRNCIVKPQNNTAATVPGVWGAARTTGTLNVTAGSLSATVSGVTGPALTAGMNIGGIGLPAENVVASVAGGNITLALNPGISFTGMVQGSPPTATVCAVNPGKGLVGGNVLGVTSNSAGIPGGTTISSVSDVPATCSWGAGLGGRQLTLSQNATVTSQYPIAFNVSGSWSTKFYAQMSVPVVSLVRNPNALTMPTGQNTGAALYNITIVDQSNNGLGRGLTGVTGFQIYGHDHERYDNLQCNSIVGTCFLFGGYNVNSSALTDHYTFVRESTLSGIYAWSTGDYLTGQAAMAIAGSPNQNSLGADETNDLGFSGANLVFSDGEALDITTYDQQHQNTTGTNKPRNLTFGNDFHIEAGVNAVANIAPPTPAIHCQYAVGYDYQGTLGIAGSGYALIQNDTCYNARVHDSDIANNGHTYSFTGTVAASTNTITVPIVTTTITTSAGSYSAVLGTGVGTINGQVITSANVPANTVITAGGGTTSITMSQPATASGTSTAATITFPIDASSKWDDLGGYIVDGVGCTSGSPCYFYLQWPNGVACTSSSCILTMTSNYPGSQTSATITLGYGSFQIANMGIQPSYDYYFGNTYTPTGGAAGKWTAFDEALIGLGSNSLGVLVGTQPICLTNEWLGYFGGCSGNSAIFGANVGFGGKLSPGFPIDVHGDINSDAVYRLSGTGALLKSGSDTQLRASGGIQFEVGGTILGGGFAAQGMPYVAIGTSITSASTIAPTLGEHHVTGTATINTITVPTGCPISNAGCFVTLIPDGAFVLGTSGNINLSSTVTATVGRPITLWHDPGTGKWSPSPTATATNAYRTLSGWDGASATGSFNFQPYNPSAAITITRITARVTTQAVGCSTAPQICFGQASTPGSSACVNVANSTSTVDAAPTGTLTFASGTVWWAQHAAGSGCGTNPTIGNVTVEYTQ